MARICIYNSGALLDSAGVLNDQALVATAGSPKRSKPVRLFTPAGEVRYIAYEFIYDGNTVSNLDVRFWLEYYGDKPSLIANDPPNLRASSLGINQSCPWAREVNEVIGGAGAITHTPTTRALLMTPGSYGTAYWMPLLVHTLWMRLAVYINGAIPAGARLIVAAHVGGHLEEQYCEDHGDVPYVYSA
jgi:hypothetical protein